MARSHARLKVSIWRDQEWLDLSPEAKLTYVALLSDPRLTIAGVVELAERRWCRSIGFDAPTLRAALTELEEHAYVVVDGETDELLIRTLSRHDLDPGRINRNLAKGFWGAWGIVESPILRSVIVHELDDVLWDALSPHGPDDAEKTRRSARLEPCQHFTVQTVKSAEDEPRSEPPLSSHLPPVTCRQPAEQRRGTLEAAAAIIGERAAARPTSGNPQAVARSVAAAVIRDRYADAYKHLAENPALTPGELAELLEPTTQVNGVHIGHDTSATGDRLEYRPVTKVLSKEPRAEPEEVLDELAKIRSQHQFLARRTVEPA